MSTTAIFILNLMPFKLATQVHSKRRNKFLHDRMRDLVFVKFNCLLKQKRHSKARDPLEKKVVDILEDGENEFITGVAANAEQAQDQDITEVECEKEQDGAGTESRKRRRVVRPVRRRVGRIIDITEGNEVEPEIASSSDTEADDHDMDRPHDPSSNSDSENSMSYE